jgi:RNA polymerase sigma-70 factor, ECF subfamily
MKDSEQRAIFKEWIGSHAGLLFKIARAYALTADDRDDLFQEISLQVWRSIPNFRNESAVTTWLYRIALNTSIRWKSKEQKHIAQDITEVPVLQAESMPHDERIDWMYTEISKLNEIDRSLCILLLDDFSYKEMAEMLGISENNVAIKIHRIKKYLIEQSKKYDYEI